MNRMLQSRPSSFCLHQNNRLRVVLAFSSLYFIFLNASSSGGDEPTDSGKRRLPFIRHNSIGYGTREGEVVAAFQRGTPLEPSEPWQVLEKENIEKPESLFQVKYYYKFDNNILHIDYKLPYLDLVAQEGIVRGVEFMGASPFRYYFPRIAIMIKNPADTPLLIRDVTAEVRKSTLNDSPIPVFGETNTPGVFILHNLGWPMATIEEFVFGLTSIDQFDNEKIFDINPRFQFKPPIALDQGHRIKMGVFHKIGKSRHSD